MNGLSRTLQWLKLPKTNSSLHIIVSPDPRRFQGYQRLATEQHEFWLKFDATRKADKYVPENPSFGFASNDGPHTLTPFSKSNKHDYSEWVRLDTIRKSANGKNLGEVLVDILDKFPRYELHSEKGVAEAIDDIEASLKPVATSEEVEGH